MKMNSDLSKKSFAVYGLGVTGLSVIDYFNKNHFKNYIGWDDNDKILKKRFGRNFKKGKKLFLKQINNVDFIILSPGIKVEKTKLKKFLIKNRRKIITDIDLFYMLNPEVKTIVVTGTNGKSTSCKIIEHVLRKNKIKALIGGNIGKPILSLNLKKNPLIIIEASSFQLFYSRFIRPNYALILNISNDHLDWHNSRDNYINSKLKIFALQKKNHLAFINNKMLLKKFRSNKYLGKIKFINTEKIKKIKSKINNDYLKLDLNEENLSFVYELSKVLKINEKSFLRSLKSFKSLDHRHEVFYKKNNMIFINDSKATSFAASKFALEGNENIFWIVGGLPKKFDKFSINNIKKNIIKTYIIGNHMNTFKKYLIGKVKISLSGTLQNALISIFNDVRKFQNKKITVLLSPASASYDQFKNFEDRGSKFKKLVKNYAKKYS